jgi:hypothetical protein
MFLRSVHTSSALSRPHPCPVCRRTLAVSTNFLCHSRIDDPLGGVLRYSGLNYVVSQWTTSHALSLLLGNRHFELQAHGVVQLSRSAGTQTHKITVINVPVVLPYDENWVTIYGSIRKLYLFKAVQVSCEQFAYYLITKSGLRSTWNVHGSNWCSCYPESVFNIFV